MKLSRRVGATSQILQIFIQDSSSTTGAGLTGLTNASAGLTAYYHRDTDTTATVISLVTMTVGTFTSSGFKEIDNVNMPGWYQFCPPNAALASGASSVGFHLKGATNMAPLPIEVDLDSQVDVYFWNGTVVATPATAGIPDVNVKNYNNQTAATDANNLPKVDTEDWKGTAVSSPATAGIPDINVKNIVNVAATLDANNVLNVSAKYWAGTLIVASSIPVGTAAGAAGGLFIAGTNAATTINGTAASGATPATAALTLVGGAASTTGGGVSAAGLSVTGGAGAASTNGAASGIITIGGGTNTVASNAHGISTTGTSTGSGIGATSGGGATGDGITATSVATNGNGLKLVSNGTGSGFLTDKLTASGAVAFQSTFAVTTSTALAALSCTTLTASGAVAFQSTFAVTTSTSLAALSCTTLTVSGAAALQSTLTVTGNVAMQAGLTVTQSTVNGAGVSITGNGSGAGLSVTGGSAVTTTAAGAGVLFTGGAASTGAGGVSAPGFKSVGGAGAASTNGAGEGMTLTGGGTTTVSGGNGFSSTGTGNLHGVSFVHAGTGFDLNATTTPLVLAKTTNITGFNDITAAAAATTIWQDLTSSGDFGTAGSIGALLKADINAPIGSIPTNPFTGTLAQIATTVWQDSTAGDFTTAGSIGKSLAPATLGTVPGAAGGLFIAGSNAATTVNITGNLSGSVGSVTAAVTVGGYSAGQDIATRRGTAQAGAAGSITLDAGASATDHLYERLQVAILSGTGAGQSGRIITGYVGSTKVAATTPNWTTNPDSSSVFALLPAAADIETILNVASFGQAGYVGIDWGHVFSPTTAVNLANSTIGTVTNAVTLPSIPANWITAAGINAGALNGKGDWMVSYVQPTGFLAANFTTGIPSTSNIKKNQSITAFPFLMTDSTTHAPKTGLGSAVTVTRSLDGGAFGAGSLGAVSEIANGWYQCSFAAADTNGNFIGFRATAANADDADIQLVTQP